jgi:hypothetical protein
MQRNLDISTPDANLVLTTSEPHHALLSGLLVVLLILIIALVGYFLIRRQGLNPAGQTTSPGGPAPDALAPERERVLKLLDAGKITAQESADLLNALGHATPPRPAKPADPVLAAGPHRKFVLIGAALLLVGFFLPWFSINLGRAMSQAMGQFGQPFGMSMTPNFSTGTTHIAGGDIGYGLGWIILLLGLTAAVLPYLAANLNPGTLQKAALVGLGIGSLILLYLLSDLARYVNVGIFVVMAGYALEFIGTLKQRPAMQR